MEHSRGREGQEGRASVQSALAFGELPRGPVSSPAWFLGGQRPGPMAPRELRIGQLLKPGLYDKNKPDGLFSLQTKMQEQ